MLGSWQNPIFLDYRMYTMAAKKVRLKIEVFNNNHEYVTWCPYKKLFIVLYPLRQSQLRICWCTIKCSVYFWNLPVARFLKKWQQHILEFGRGIVKNQNNESHTVNNWKIWQKRVDCLQTWQAGGWNLFLTSSTQVSSLIRLWAKKRSLFSGL